MQELLAASSIYSRQHDQKALSQLPFMQEIRLWALTPLDLAYLPLYSGDVYSVWYLSLICLHFVVQANEPPSSFHRYHGSQKVTIRKQFQLLSRRGFDILAPNSLLEA